MISNEDANNYIKLESNNFNYIKTFRDIICEFSEIYGSSDYDIKDYILNDAHNIIVKWSEDNCMSFNDMINFIMDNLDSEFKLEINIDLNYDCEIKQTYISLMNPHNTYYKECKFFGNIYINNKVLYLGEWVSNIILG
jgi:hypothetical protein